MSYGYIEKGFRKIRIGTCNICYSGMQVYSTSSCYACWYCTNPNCLARGCDNLIYTEPKIYRYEYYKGIPLKIKVNLDDTFFESLEKQTKEKCQCCNHNNRVQGEHVINDHHHKDETNYGRFTICWNKHGQHCPYCNIYLRTYQDNYGGGSHYWSLECVKCHRNFSYGTYDFKLYEIITEYK